ncbi:MAG: hypothetical protein JXJ04_18920, partial [Spirochaetales bacterium]|nr:hypothetical protein [Spirochaetales bacterium]
SGHIYADEEFTFINITPEFFRIGNLGDGYIMFSGLLVEFYLGGNILGHGGLNYHYSDSYGFHLDVGLSYIVKSSFNRTAKYFQVFERRIDDQWVEQTTIKGTCKAAWFHMIDIGLSAYFLETEGDYYNDAYYFRDIMVYAGYCLASFYEVLIPIQEINVVAHGLIGLKNRTSQMGIVSPLDIAVGGKLGVKWYYFACHLGFYDENFYFDIGFRLPITIMFK